MRLAENVTAGSGLSLDILVEADIWHRQPDSEAVIRQAIGAAEKMTPRAHGEIAILLADDATIRTLNEKWRGQDKPTNVLSFPGSDTVSVQAAPAHLGDIVIAFETTAREA